jgi:transcription elongation factor GreA
MAASDCCDGLMAHDRPRIRGLSPGPGVHLGETSAAGSRIAARAASAIWRRAEYSLNRMVEAVRDVDPWVGRRGTDAASPVPLRTEGSTVYCAARASDSRSMTQEGYDRLREELAVLSTERREEVAEWLRAAREDGADPSENDDLADALQQQERLDGRIMQLEEILADARVVPPSDDGIVAVGTRVQVGLENGQVVEYELVGASEADASNARISIASPVGRALHGRAPGDVLDVETPRGRKRLQVVAVDIAATPLVAA